MIISRWKGPASPSPSSAGAAQEPAPEPQPEPELQPEPEPEPEPAPAPARQPPAVTTTTLRVGSRLSLQLTQVLEELDEDEAWDAADDVTGGLVWAACAEVACLCLAGAARLTPDASAAAAQVGAAVRAEGRRVAELGAGTGACGIGAALLGASHVLLTDLPQFCPNIRRNCAANGLQVSQEGAVRVVPHQWGAPVSDLGGPFDIVICSELLHWPALDIFSEDTLQPLARSILALLRPPVSSDQGGGGGKDEGGVALVVYRSRLPAREATFFETCEALGLRAVGPFAAETTAEAGETTTEAERGRAHPGGGGGEGEGRPIVFALWRAEG